MALLGLAHLSTPHYALLAAGLLVARTAQLVVRRLYLSPIAHIPGPKLAALTRLYEFYYDIVLGGQYTFKVLELHKQYGPIVRISPWEIHVGDPDFFPKLYTGPSRRREKWAFYTKQVCMPRSTTERASH